MGGQIFSLNTFSFLQKENTAKRKKFLVLGEASKGKRVEDNKGAAIKC